MTERGLPSVDGSPACPFVAFEDDRDERAPVPDHRHRCYAEARPAPRALAHQEAYCLSSAFPVCPTFQEWARREAARASSATVTAPEASRVADDRDDGSIRGHDDEPRAEREPYDAMANGEPPAEAADDEPVIPVEMRPRRNPRRDWAAPPPWASGPGGPGAPLGPGRGAGRINPDDEPEVVERRAEGRGLAGSAADRLAAGERVVLPPAHGVGEEPAGAPPPRVRSAAPDPELAGLVGGGRPVPSAPTDVVPPPPRRTRPRTVSSSRSGPERARERDRDRPAEVVHDGPSWERGRRFEAYPQIRAGRGIPDLPRAAVLAIALVIAAVAVFFLPALFVGNKGPASPAPSASQVVQSASPEPTLAPAPSQQTYTIKTGDTLTRVAKRFGVTLDQLLAANKSIKDANKIKVGDVIVIPSASFVPAASAASASP